MNINKFDGADLTFDKLVKSISAVPFLAEKRLIIIKNFLRDGDEKLREYITENFQKFSDSSVVIIAEEGEVKKTLSFYKKMQKADLIVHFPLRKGYDLEKWLVEQATLENINLKLPAAKRLITLVGNNGWRLINELKKLDLYRIALGKEQIEDADIEAMVEGENDSNIFDFIDALGARDSKMALVRLEELIKSGKNENYILTMIVYQFRNMMIVQDLIARGIAGPQIAKEAELNPYVAEKTIRLLKIFDLPMLRRVYYRLMQTDLDIKTGKVEPKLALEKLLADLTI
jgi:DNA polymerase-3 subunit delta